MEEMWYYTNNGKQMEPVTAAVLKQMAASGTLTPADLVWKEGMATWVRASSVKDLFSAGGMITAPTLQPDAPGRQAAIQDNDHPEDRDDRPRRAQRRDAGRFDDAADEEDRPRRRRRQPAADTGMSTGLKVGLILGGSLLGIILIAVVVIAAMRSHHQARAQVQAHRAVNFKPPAIIIPPNQPAPFEVKNPPPIFLGPLNVGPAGLLFNEQLTNADARDVKTRQACKVYAVNMTAGKTYTIRQNRSDNAIDPYLRIEDSNFNQVALDDDGGGNLNALVIYQPTQTGVYRVIATTLVGTGNFSLQITEN